MKITTSSARAHQLLKSGQLYTVNGRPIYKAVISGVFFFSNFQPISNELNVIFSLSGSNNTYETLTLEAYREIFNEFYVPVRNFLYFKCSDAELAEDLAQDTFVKLWENRERIDRKTVKAYLYTIAGNAAINYLKRQQLQHKFINSASDRSDRDTPAFLMEMDEFQEKLQKVIGDMPDGSREVFLMNRIEDLKYREIAERLNISIKAVEKRMSKALQILREKLNIEV